MTGSFAAYNFAESRDEAKQRYLQFKQLDPLPDVTPALLNAGDIYDYVRITSMVYPFAKESRIEEKLKWASYEIDFLGEVHEINEDGTYGAPIQVKPGSQYELRKNSIAFIFLETMFFLPYYIGVRFNLRITNVHRGLLLGTGPLVDPGFYGRLLIPLHNLTTETYVLVGGEGFIWAEFTKLSAARKEASLPIEHKKQTALELEHKLNLTAQDYFDKASKGKPAASSIPGEIRTAVENATEARGSAESAREETKKLTERYTFWGAIGGGIALLSLLVGLVMLASNTWSLVGSTTVAVSVLKDEMRLGQESIEGELSEIRAELEALKKAEKPSSANSKPGKTP